MILQANKKQISAYSEFAYTLSQDFTTSSFPTYLDGTKTKEVFLRIVHDYRNGKYPNSEILLYSEEGVVLGWIHYYWWAEDRYIGFEAFYTAKNAEKAIDEFLTYANRRFNGYQIDFGFPAENREALSHLAEIGFVLAEASDVFTLHFDKYRPFKEDPNVVVVDESNWKDFRALHDKEEMYWNSDRLYRALLKKTSNKWVMFLYYKENRAIGNIYFCYAGGMMEIFGMDGEQQEACMKPLLVKALNRAKADGMQHLTFFAEGIESKIAEDLGLKCITQYKMFRNRA